MHKQPFGAQPLPKVFDETVRSQFKVAKEIIKHPGCPVLKEGLIENVSDSAVYPLAKVVKEILFPNGFPKHFNELTEVQKDFLYEEGAAITLFYLGEIPSIYKSIHKEVSDVIDKQISEQITIGEDKIEVVTKYIPQRDMEAIECAKEAAIQHFGNFESATVIIVMGKHHDLKPYCDKEGLEYEVIGTTTSTFQPIPSERKQPEMKGQEPSKVQSTLFMPSFTSSNNVPGALQHALKDGGLEDYIKRGHISLNQLIDLYEKSPWVIGALRCSNIRKGIYNQQIDIAQLSRLSEEQVNSTKHQFHDQELKSKVENYIKSNQKQI